MTSDRMFKEPVARAAKQLALKNTSPVYFYEFGYRGKYSLSDKYTKAGHSDGLGKQNKIKKVIIRYLIIICINRSITW